MHAIGDPAAAPGLGFGRPVVVGHRGAPAYRPEHTTAGFELAIDQGADLIEVDLVVSRDGALIARHENELSLSTDVARRPKHAGRYCRRVVAGEEHAGWFAEDFTLAELRTLRALERMPALRPLNTGYERRSGLLTLAEVVALARRRSTPQRPIRVLAELKEPSWSAAQGLPMVDLLADELRRLSCTGSDGDVVVQSFDTAGLRRLRGIFGSAGPSLVQLVWDEEWMITPSGLREISTYAQGVAPSVEHLLPRDAAGKLRGSTDLVDQAHRAQLSVLAWTLRAENAFLPLDLRIGDDPAAPGDAAGEARLLLELGVDGLITDAPDIAVAVRRERENAAVPAAV